MKKKVIILSLALMMIAVGVVSAAAKWGTFEGYNIVKLVIDGEEVVPKDTPPVILEGRTMVPIAMLEQAGVKATWNSKNYTVNVTTNSTEHYKNDALSIQKYAILSDAYTQLKEFYHSLSPYGGILNRITYFKESELLEDLSATHVSVIEYQLEMEDRLAHEYFSDAADYDAEPINDILDDYKLATDNLTLALESTLEYLKTNDMTYYNNYIRYLDRAMTFATKARGDASDSYDNLISTIYEYE